MSDIANELGGKESRRPFYVRVLDSLVPSLITAVATALMVGWVSLNVMKAQIDDLTVGLRGNTQRLDVLEIKYAALQGESNEYVKRLDMSLAVQNQIAQKLDERLTFLERAHLNSR